MPDTLCMQCGLCCDGTLYGSVVIASEEEPRLSRVGLRIVQNDGAPVMPQPCSALRGCLCSVYEDRPSSCAQYECTLRRRVSAGLCSPAEALAKVDEVRELLVVIRAAFDCPPESSVWQAIAAFEPPTTPEGIASATRDYAVAIDAVAALLRVVRTEIEPRFAGGGAR